MRFACVLMLAVRVSTSGGIRNKRKNRLKVLWLDRNGLCILYKRLHRARFEIPDSRIIDAKTLALVLRGVENMRR